MKPRTRDIFAFLTLMMVTLSVIRIAHTQETTGNILQREPPPMILRTPATIIDSFLKTETQLRQTLNQHTFRRDVVLQTIGPNGNVTGEYIRNSQFVFDDNGNRVERVTYHPPSTIREMRITKEDIKDLAGAQLLGVDVLESVKYQMTCAGEELLSGKRVYRLAVEPAVNPNPYQMSERFFRGTIWIDAVTFQLVKVHGRVEPQGKQRFPTFETWREPVNSTFNFPTRTEADDVLRFPNRDVNYRIRVRYYDYKLFASTVKVKEVEGPAGVDKQ
ncbi:MAG TPA: hypothetical protein VFI24_08590 [Pyrinomonadaceae bacterium]|nr:hypothetical protein [Pyrinomonadaceae bacterium]